MRQISRIVQLTKGTGTRQIHILTTFKDMGAAKLIYLLGARGGAETTSATPGSTSLWTLIPATEATMMTRNVRRPTLPRTSPARRS